MKDWVYVGAKVVCVGGAAPGSAKKNHSGITRFPTAGTVYTIRDVRAFHDGLGIRLAEFGHKCLRWTDGFYEPFWSARCFKPVVSIDAAETVSSLVKLMQKARDEKRVTVVA